jgi:hypothetical protein
MSLKERIVLWFAERALRKRLGVTRAQWKELKMKPLPKWMGWIGAIAAVAPMLWTAYHTGGATALVMAIVSLLGGGTVLNSHSAGGTGGTLSNP